MNKAFEKILERLEDGVSFPKMKGMERRVGTRQTQGFGLGVRFAKEIVQDVAKEYSNGWIACSDRLPVAKEKRFGNKQKRTDVLVTLRNGVVKEMTYEFATKKFWEAGDENPIEHWKEDYNGNDIEVIAWQALPEPYELT